MRISIAAIIYALLNSVPLSPAAAADLPECAEGVIGVCRLALDVTKEEAIGRLGDRSVIWWAEGDVLTVLARHPGPAVELCCSLQESMERIGDSEAWGLSARVPRLEEGVLDFLILPPVTSGPLRPEVWRGPRAPAAPPRAEALSGVVEDYLIDSYVMGERRKLTVYLPAAAASAVTSGGRLPVIYMADGQAVPGYAGIVDALITQGRIRPVILVGIWPGPEGEFNPADPDWRSLEYVSGLRDGEVRFPAHRRFVAEELLPWAERTFPVSSKPEDRIVAGQSNGGAWALSTLRAQPELFKAGILMSPAGREPETFEALRGIRLHVGAGSLEGALADRVARISDGASAAGADTTSMLPVGGHSPEVWDLVLAEGLLRLLGQVQDHSMGGAQSGSGS